MQIWNARVLLEWNRGVFTLTFHSARLGSSTSKCTCLNFNKSDDEFTETESNEHEYYSIVFQTNNLIKEINLWINNISRIVSWNPSNSLLSKFKRSFKRISWINTQCDHGRPSMALWLFLQLFGIRNSNQNPFVRIIPLFNFLDVFAEASEPICPGLDSTRRKIWHSWTGFTSYPITLHSGINNGN